MFPSFRTNHITSKAFTSTCPLTTAFAPESDRYSQTADPLQITQAYPPALYKIFNSRSQASSSVFSSSKGKVGNQEMDIDATSSSLWARLSHDVTELILSRLPPRSLARASAVCRNWRSLISDPSFSTRTRNRPWLFLFGQNNVFLKQNQAFGFDPDSSAWIRLPNSPLHDECFAGAGGLLFSSSSSRFRYSPLLARRPPGETSPLSFPRLNPLVARRRSPRRIVVAGGARFIGGLVDIEDRLAVEIYDLDADAWEICPPLPSPFPSSSSSSQWLSSALILDRYFFVFGIFSSFVSAFDLESKSWSNPQILRCEGVLFSFLIACRDRLILAGLCDAGLRLWVVDWRRGWERREIGAMPVDLMGRLLDGGDDDDDDDAAAASDAKFASLRCVGLDGLVYVFNEDRSKGYPACVCEIGDDWECEWRAVPPLPVPVNRFDKVIAFSSDVPLPC